MKADYKIAPHLPKREIFSFILLLSEAVMLLAYWECTVSRHNQGSMSHFDGINGQFKWQHYDVWIVHLINYDIRETKNWSEKQKITQSMVYLTPLNLAFDGQN